MRYRIATNLASADGELNRTRELEKTLDKVRNHLHRATRGMAQFGKLQQPYDIIWMSFFYFPTNSPSAISGRTFHMSYKSMHQGGSK